MALHTRFSWSDLVDADDCQLYRLCVGIAKDSQVENVSAYAEACVEDVSWMGAQWRDWVKEARRRRDK